MLAALTPFLAPVRDRGSPPAAVVRSLSRGRAVCTCRRFNGATEWLNTEPLGPAELRRPRRPRELLDAHLHQLAAPGTARAGVGAAPTAATGSSSSVSTHPSSRSSTSPTTCARRSASATIDYPVVIDNDYAVWSAFANHYWPALYFVDADGVIQDQHFGEGRYERVRASPPATPRHRPATRRRQGDRRRGGRRLGPTCERPRPTSATAAASDSSPGRPCRLRRPPHLRGSRAAWT